MVGANAKKKKDKEKRKKRDSFWLRRIKKKQTNFMIYLFTDTFKVSASLLDAAHRNEVSVYQLASDWRWKAAFWCSKINTFTRTPGHNGACLLGDNSHLCKITMLILLSELFDLNFRAFVSQLHIIPPGAVQSIRVREEKKKKSPVKRYTVVQKHWVDLCGNVIQSVIMFRKGLRPLKQTTKKEEFSP